MGLLWLIQILAVVVLFDIYIALVLSVFPATRDLSEKYFEFVSAPVVTLWKAFVGYLPNAVEILVISVLTPPS